jgi:hypothetical protein
LIGANTLIEPLEGVGPENLDFFGPKSSHPGIPSHINNRQINSEFARLSEHESKGGLM